jgi:hypothetical protein
VELDAHAATVLHDPLALLMRGCGGGRILEKRRAGLLGREVGLQRRPARADFEPREPYVQRLVLRTAHAVFVSRGNCYQRPRCTT